MIKNWHFKNYQIGSTKCLKVPCVQIWQKIPRGSVLNCQSKCAMCDATRWFIKKTSIFWQDSFSEKYSNSPGIAIKWHISKMTKIRPEVTALFTKPQGSFQPPAPFTAYGSFRNCTRQNHGTAGNREASGFVNSAVMVSYSPIHKTAGSLVTGHSLQNGKMSMGNRCTERPPDPVLYGGRPSGGFVNRAVMCKFDEKFQKEISKVANDGAMR